MVATPKETGEPSRKRVSSLKCFGCGELGHFKRICPHKDKLSTDISESKSKREYTSQQNRSEAPGSTSAHLVLLFQLSRLVLLNYQRHL